MHAHVYARIYAHVCAFTQAELGPDKPYITDIFPNLSGFFPVVQQPQRWNSQTTFPSDSLQGRHCCRTASNLLSPSAMCARAIFIGQLCWSLQPDKRATQGLQGAGRLDMH